MKQFYVYIMASRRNGTLYIVVTSDLIKRIWQHKEKNIEGFTCKYDVGLLVYFQIFESAEEAIKQEKRLKKYLRKDKIALIEKENPAWNDLYSSLL